MHRSACWALVLVFGCATPQAAKAPAETAAPQAESTAPAPAEEPVATSSPSPTPAPAVPVEAPARIEPAPAADATPKTEAAPTAGASPKAEAAPKTETTARAATAPKTEPAPTPKVEAPAKTEVATKVAAPDKKTERTWKAKCGSCHGADGKAQTDKGQKMKLTDLSTAKYQSSRTDAQIRKAIVEGVKAPNGDMDGYPELSPAEVTALVGYVRWVGAPK